LKRGATFEVENLFFCGMGRYPQHFGSGLGASGGAAFAFDAVPVVQGLVVQGGGGLY